MADYKWPPEGAGGTGDVVGPASATENAVARFDGTTGKLIKNSLVLIDDAGNVSGITGISTSGDATVGGNLTVVGTTTLATTLSGVLKAASGVVSASLIVNADVSASAAIAYSKLNLTGSIVNADINAAAAIAYSKLNLTGSIVNADISASAAIAYSKLALADSIVNADINSAAAIAYSKLALTDSIVNADINASAGIVDTKLATISTAGKVSNSATTATDANTASAIVARDGSGNFSASTITATLNGNATNVTGTVAIGNGGTGQTSKAAAFDALSPMTTAGDLIYGGASGTGTRLGAGTTGDWLLQGGSSAPVWSSTVITAKVIDGSADAVQLTVEGHSTQTNNILNVQRSDTTNLLAVTDTGGTQIRGTTTNDAAAIGFVGQYSEASATGGNNFPTSTQFGDLVSVSLTPGDWDVSILLVTDKNGSTTTAYEMGFSATSGNSSTGLTLGLNYAYLTAGTATDGNSGSIPPYRISLSATTTYYLKYKAIYSAGTPRAYGRITARRVR